MVDHTSCVTSTRTQCPFSDEDDDWDESESPRNTDDVAFDELDDADPALTRCIPTRRGSGPTSGCRTRTGGPMMCEIIVSVSARCRVSVGASSGRSSASSSVSDRGPASSSSVSD